MIPVEGHSDYRQVCSMYFINKHASYKDETKALWAMKHSSVTSVADVCHHIVIVQTVTTSDCFPVLPTPKHSGYDSVVWLFVNKVGCLYSRCKRAIIHFCMVLCLSGIVTNTQDNSIRIQKWR